jgi:hypothetical protein
MRGAHMAWCHLCQERGSHLGSDLVNLQLELALLELGLGLGQLCLLVLNCL